MLVPDYLLALRLEGTLAPFYKLNITIALLLLHMASVSFAKEDLRCKNEKVISRYRYPFFP